MRRAVALIFTVVASLDSSIAAKNDPIVALRYTPTDTGAQSNARITGLMATNPVELVVEDQRVAVDRLVIGSRTTDSDKLFELKAKSDVLPYLKSTIEHVVAEWGLKLEPGAPIVLRVRIASLEISERNQAVGATYSAVVSTDAELSRRDGAILWTGNTTGDTSRYGRKFSNDNVNEVQSDALKRMLANLLGNPGLQTAWSGTAVVASVPAERPLPILTGQQMLEELKTMQAAGVGESTLLEFVRSRALAAPLTSADVIAWKDAGLPEAVVRAGLSAR